MGQILKNKTATPIGISPSETPPHLCANKPSRYFMKKKIKKKKIMPMRKSTHKST
jgi:hypothetical protein